ncbi:MAG: hypothetical protein IPL23_19390 [Saprospiraceae bacterium]|nr:hypothetical protein [Saprospiraceae bacterium]
MTELTFKIVVIEIPIIDFGLDNPVIFDDSLHVTPTVTPAVATLAWKDGFPASIGTSMNLVIYAILHNWVVVL